MLLATAAVSALLASLLAFAAIRKLSHRPEVVSEYARAGVPERWLDRLAALLLAGAGALLLGLVWRPLGIAGAAALVAYFAAAIGFHLRAGDARNAPTPAAMAALAAAVLVLQLAAMR